MGLEEATPDSSDSKQKRVPEQQFPGHQGRTVRSVRVSVLGVRLEEPVCPARKTRCSRCILRSK